MHHQEILLREKLPPLWTLNLEKQTHFSSYSIDRSSQENVGKVRSGDLAGSGNRHFQLFQGYLSAACCGSILFKLRLQMRSKPKQKIQKAVDDNHRYFLCILKETLASDFHGYFAYYAEFGLW